MASSAEEKLEEPTCIVEIEVPDNRLEVVTGPSNCTINLIREKTAVKSINIEANVARIEGKADAVALAQQAIEEVMHKGFCSLQFGGFKEDRVEVPSSSVPDIIGEEGCNIMAIKEAMLVEIDVPEGIELPGNSPERTTVMIAGKSESVEMAKLILKDIVMYYHHEVTHPGWVHEEMDVDPENYRYIVGEDGSELRHIEENFKVRARIPRDESPNKNVVVVGERSDVDGAVAYIHNLITKAKGSKGQSASDKAED